MESTILTNELQKSYSAKIAYSNTTALGRLNIKNIFISDAMRGLIAEHCGSDGFRVVDTHTNERTTLSSASGTLSAVCWDPEFVPAKAKRQPPDPLSDPFEDKTVRTGDGTAYFGRSGGKEHGIVVHKEVQHFVQWKSKRFEAAHEKADPMTRALCCCIVDQGIEMIDSERIVHDRVWRCGSAFDVLGLLKKTGEVVGIELKTGSDGTFHLPCRKNPYMRAPYFHDIPNTPLNRARMQLLFNCIVAERSHGITIEHAYVVHVPNIKSPAVAIGLGYVAKKRPLLVKAIEEWRVAQGIERRNNERLISSTPVSSFDFSIPIRSAAEHRPRAIKKPNKGTKKVLKRKRDSLQKQGGSVLKKRNLQPGDAFDLARSASPSGF